MESGKKANKQKGVQEELVNMLLNTDQLQLKRNLVEFQNMIEKDTSEFLRSIGYAGILTAEKSDQAVWNSIQNDKTRQKDYLNGIFLLTNENLKASFYEKVKSMTATFPDQAYPLLVSMRREDVAKTENFKDYIAYLNNTPPSNQSPESFSKTISKLKSIIPELPEKDRAEVSVLLENMGTVEIKLTAIEAKMAFDKKEISVPAGKSVSLIFENPDLMPHNVVIVKPGTTQKVGEAADAMAKLKDGFERNFVPDSKDVLFATPLVNSGKSFRLNFKAPEQPGEYPFICSFPGHWRVMTGILKVTEKKIP